MIGQAGLSFFREVPPDRQLTEVHLLSSFEDAKRARGRVEVAATKNATTTKHNQQQQQTTIHSHTSLSLLF